MIGADPYHQTGFGACAQPSQPARHARVTRRFATAWSARDVPALEHLLAPGAIVITDGGGRVRAATQPTRGAANVAQLVSTLLDRHAGAVLTIEHVNGRAGIALRQADEVIAVVTLGLTRARICAVWIVLNPDKLHPWRQA